MPRNSKKTVLDTYLDTYVEKIAEIAEGFKPTPIPPYTIPEPIKFDIDMTLQAQELAQHIMEILHGHTVELIMAASNVVEQYVSAQSRGSYFIRPSKY